MKRASGGGSLAILMVLLLGATLVLLYANRAMMFEQRASAQQVRAALALQAADAGVAWTLAQLNQPHVIDAQCAPAAAAAASATFAQRHLRSDATGVLGPAGDAQPACVARDGP